MDQRWKASRNRKQDNAKYRQAQLPKLMV